MNASNANFIKERYSSTIKELRELLIFSPDEIKKCTHSESNPDLRILVDDQFFSKVSNETLIKFLVLTGIDQMIFLGDPRTRNELRDVLGDIPIPVTYGGFGCVDVLTPAKLFDAHLKYVKSNKRNLK